MRLLAVTMLLGALAPQAGWAQEAPAPGRTAPDLPAAAEAEPGAAPMPKPDAGPEAPPARLGIQTGTLNWTVCPAGCTFRSPLDAWGAARGIAVFGPYAAINVQVADGTYDIPGVFYTAEAGMRSVHLNGNTADPGRVVFRFTNITGNNAGGFVAEGGGRIGQPGQPGVNGVTLLGVGARRGRSAWAEQSYGAGFFALGSGSNIQVGAKVVVDGFYYSVFADQGGRAVASGGTFRNAGDSNLLARFGGVIECQSCTMQAASHIFANAYGGMETLGQNALAEGGTIWVDGSTASGGQVACIGAQSNGLAWAHGVHASGCLGQGVRAVQNGFIEAGHATVTESQVGAYATSGGGINLDGAELHHNAGDGVLADGGHVHGHGVNAHDNGGYGVDVIKQGRAELYDTAALLRGDGRGPVHVEPASRCAAASQPCSSASALILN